MALNYSYDRIVVCHKAGGEVQTLNSLARREVYDVKRST